MKRILLILAILLTPIISWAGDFAIQGGGVILFNNQQVNILPVGGAPATWQTCSSGIIISGPLITGTSGQQVCTASNPLLDGAFWEITMTGTSSGGNVGWATSSVGLSNYLCSDAYGWCDAQSAVKCYNGSTSGYGSSFTTGDTLGIGWKSGTFTTWLNGTSQGTIYSGLSGTYYPAVSFAGTSSATAHFHTFTQNYGTGAGNAPSGYIPYSN